MVNKILPDEKLAILKKLKEKKLKEIEEAEDLIFEAKEEFRVRDEEELKFRALQEKLRKRTILVEDPISNKTEGVISTNNSDDSTEKNKKSDSDNDLEVLVGSGSSNSNNNHITGSFYGHDSSNYSNQSNNFDEYISNLSIQPTNDLYKEITDVYQHSKDRGYVSPGDLQKITNLAYAMDKKSHDAQSGMYTMSENLKLSTSLSEQIKKSMSTMYNPSSQ